MIFNVCLSGTLCLSIVCVYVCLSVCLSITLRLSDSVCNILSVRRLCGWKVVVTRDTLWSNEANSAYTTPSVYVLVEVATVVVVVVVTVAVTSDILSQLNVANSPPLQTLPVFFLLQPSLFLVKTKEVLRHGLPFVFLSGCLSAE